MTHLILRFPNKEAMDEWVEDHVWSDILPKGTIARQADSLDKAKPRDTFVLEREDKGGEE